MKRTSSISTIALFATMASAATPGTVRAPITTAQIAAAISGAGMAITAEQVTLLTDVTAATGSPSLKVELIEPWGDHRMKVRIDCESGQECMPFFVAVRCAQQLAAEPGTAAMNHSPAATAPARIDPKSILMHAGAPATLFLEGGRVHIRLAVVCLENGALGQTIKVSSKDHRQTYVGKVVDGEVLRASL
jgi:hypothetical protein